MIRPAVISFSSSASGFAYAVDRLRDLSGETESVYPMDTPLLMPSSSQVTQALSDLVKA